MDGRMKLWFTWYGANTVDKSLPVLSTLIVVVVLSKRVKVDKYACLSKWFGDILSRSPAWDEGRGLSYPPCLLMKPVLRLRLHATQSQPCFPAVSNALALPGGNGIFAATPTERITHYTLQASRVPKGKPLWKPRTTKQAEYLALPPVLDIQPLFVVSSPRFVVCV